jgi:chemotaxis protein MotB
VGRRKKQEEHENHERWLVSYADFITLLFAFFTTLYAISTVDATKAGKMQYSMRQSFDASLFESGSKSLSLSQGSGGGSENSEIFDSLKFQENIQINKVVLSKSEGNKRILSSKEELYELKRSIEGLLGAEALKGTVRLTVDSRGLVLSLGEGGFFDSGSEILRPEGRGLLDTIATSLVLVDNMIRIEGHTDTDPIHNSKFPSNWELSTSRATEILKYLITKFGFNPELLSAAGYGEMRPVAPNDTPEGKARNRRVDIVILNPAAAQSEPSRSAIAATTELIPQSESSPR